MHNKEIIQWLILQDLQHRQITCCRCSNPIIELQELSILNIIVKLIGIDVDKDKVRICNQLIEAYYGFLENESDELETLADKIYQLFVACVHLDRKRPPTNNTQS